MITFKEKTTDLLDEKDFLPKAIDSFFKFRGRELYSEPISSTKPSGTKLAGLSKGKFSTPEVKGIIKEVTIIHPASHREYKASEFVYTGKPKDSTLDLGFKVSVKEGLIVPEEFEYYNFLMYTLGKYTGDYDYKFVMVGSNPPKPIITIPNSKTGWINLVRALTEFCVSLKLFFGIKYYVWLVPEEVPEAKNFSGLASFIPTLTSLVYKTIVLPILKKRVALKWEKSLTTKYSSSLLPKLLKKIKGDWGDKLILGDCTQQSYYLNLTKGKQAAEVRKVFTNKKFLEDEGIDPERRRCPVDWWAFAASKEKDLIMISDLDPVPAIFHEVGHFLANNENLLGPIQRASHRGVFSDGFVSLASFLLGTGGGIAGSPVGEISGWVVSILLKFPTLCTEFMASWYGLQLMKSLGATDKDLTEAKYAFKTAFSTYVLSALGKAGNSGYGRLLGEGIKRYK
ncbi:MAG: hypothetical protein J6I84_04735 [Bacilli bacterium]|nr:hypothetical protein [Bacilli bacterium]